MTQITDIEQRLLTPLPTPALEALRKFAVQMLVTEPSAAARNISRRALGTELGMVFAGLSLPPGYHEAPLPSPRRLADVAPTLRTVRPLFEPAVRELAIATPYKDILRTHLTADSFRANISALCAVLLVAALSSPES
jgi:hypothetical protein